MSVTICAVVTMCTILSYAAGLVQVTLTPDVVLRGDDMIGTCTGAIESDLFIYFEYHNTTRNYITYAKLDIQDNNTPVMEIELPHVSVVGGHPSKSVLRVNFSATTCADAGGYRCYRIAKGFNPDSHFEYKTLKVVAWQPLVHGIRDDAPTSDSQPTPQPGHCLPTEAKTSSLTYEIANDDGVDFRIKCEVELKMADSRVYTTEAIMSVCVVGAAERTTTTSKPMEKKTTPKPKNKDGQPGFLASGVGIAVISAVAVLVVAGLAGGVYWYMRHRSSSTPPTATQDDYYADGYYAETQQ